MDIRVDGRLAYCYGGGKDFDAARPTVLFVHGAAQDHSCWTLPARWFAHHGCNALAPDLPGHGRSGGPALASVAAIADWLAALLGELGVERADVVGHSLGALAALQLASARPTRVRRLALLGAAAAMPVADALLAAAANDEDRARTMVNVWSHSPAARLGGSATPGLWLLGVNQRLMERQERGVLHDDLAACQAYGEGEAAAARVRCPALVLAGDRDRMAPAAATARLAATLPDPRQVVLDGCGHALMAERPDAVLDALRQFLLP